MQHKLVSPNDTLLGTVTIPDHWSERLFNRHPYHSVHIMTRPPSAASSVEDLPVMADIKRVTLAVSYGRYKDALMIVQGTIEDLEEVEGCSFSPSMAYLRSQIEAANI